MTVRAVRRLAAVAVVGAIALAGLAGCRVETGTAAFVGDTRYSEQEVTALLDEVTEHSGDQPVTLTRQQLVTTIVGRDVSKAAAEARGLSPAQISTQEVAQAEQVPPDTEYARIATDYYGYRMALSDAVPPATPTEADLQSLYDRLVSFGAAEPGQSTAQFRAGVNPQDLQLFARTLGLRDALAEQVQTHRVSVSPRYDPAALSLLQVRTQQGAASLVDVNLDSDTSPPAVIDRS